MGQKKLHLRCTPLSRQKTDFLKVLSLPRVFVFTSENEKPVGPVGIFHRPYALAFKIRESIFSVSALAACVGAEDAKEIAFIRP
jgi:hypothetical protein